MKYQILTIMLIAVLLSGTVHAGWIEDAQGFFGSLGGAPRLFSVGFTTLSISPSDFRSSDSILNGPVWVLSVRQGGLAQRAEGTISASNIQANGKTAQKGFSLDIASTEQSCEYPITVDYSSFPIYNYGFKKYVCSPLGSCFTGQLDQQQTSDCSSFGEIYTTGKFPSSFDLVCVYRNKISSYVGNLKESGNTIFKSEIELQVDGDSSVKATISNKATSFVQLGSIAYAQWQGNLVTGETCPSPSQQTIKSAYIQGNWKLISSTRYNDYATYTANQFIDPDTVTEQQLQSVLNNINSKANLASGFQSFTSDGGNTAQLQNQGSVTSGLVKLNLDNAIQFPVFTFYVKASTLGIYQPVADVAIQTAAGATFKTGETGSISVEIKNVGNERGGFTVWATCESPFLMSGSNKEFTIEPGQTIFTNIPIVASASSKTTANCVVHAKTLSKEVTYTVSMTVDPQSVCASNTVRCLDDVIKTCNSAGSGYDESKTLDCKSQGKICGTVNSQLACVDKDGSDDETDVCGSDSLWVKLNPLNWLEILDCKIKDAAGAIVLVVVTMIAFVGLLTLLKFPFGVFANLIVSLVAAIVIYLALGWAGSFVVIGLIAAYAYVKWKTS